MNPRLLCPAKINTFLSVGKPDSTGYHPIRSIFQTVSLFDELEIEETGTESITFSDPTVPDSNTVTKALSLLRQKAEIPPLQIHVTKVIPSEAGLGGGSSDAASVLKWAGERYAPNIDLTTIAARVGADVPFFLTGGRAKVTGYGEIIEATEPTPKSWLVIVKPEVGCPTGEMYRKLDALDHPWREFPSTDELCNDFERVAPCECLDWIERLLTLGAVDAGLSGSGSAVFGRFLSAETASHAASQVIGPKTFLAETLS